MGENYNNNMVMYRINRDNLTTLLEPLVQYGLGEAETTDLEHAMLEVAINSYLLGMGFDRKTAYMIAETWEENEIYPYKKNKNRL